ncbi:acireductone synthase [Streptomyces sp. OE57]|uniref:acireductone synthase n=1 Tax=Streptomyces lacaronensis TaxID=3379885 RepID=UPI0039B78F2E
MPDVIIRRHGVRAVVLDIEGTVGSAGHVREVLFPYARDRIAPWFAQRRGTAVHAELLRDVQECADDPSLDEDAAVRTLLAWSDGDVKARPLKAVQSLIWADGYADGTLHGHVYPEVPAALERWRGAGLAPFVYSSGAKAAQRDWFAHSDAGDLTGLLDGYFDLTDAGPKQDPASYRYIAHSIGMPARSLVFLNDTSAELDAASAAGWQTVAIRRDDDPCAVCSTHYPTARSLDQLVLVPADGAETVPRSTPEARRS